VDNMYVWNKEKMIKNKRIIYESLWVMW